MIYRNMQLTSKLEASRQHIGPYDKLYASSPGNILWGSRPSRLVDWYMSKFNSPQRLLDLGCGDGVNSFALENRGYSVVGVDISELALRGLSQRFKENGTSPLGDYYCLDVEDIEANSLDVKFDCIISCGLFQCLDSATRVADHQALLTRYLVEGGLVLFSCLTDAISLPSDHSTSNLSLVSESEIEQLFQGYEIIQSYCGEINDAHPPTVAMHKHSIHWTIAKSPREISH